MRRILVTGSTGQLGWQLQRTLAVLGEVIALDVNEMDLSSPDSIRKAIRDVTPDLIVNPAAYTAVDRAESEPELAMAINGAAPGIIGEEAKRLGACVVHYSTDYVFDGTKQGAYTELDVPNPLNVYGRTKHVGEQALAAAGCRYAVVRTSWLYDARGDNFFLTILRLARERDELKIVADQFGAPTWARLLAEATAQMITPRRPAAAGYAAGSPLFDGGVFHLTCAGDTSWHGFASAIVQECRARGHDGAVKTARVEPIPTEAYQAPARRPRNSRLDNTKVIDQFGISMPRWDTALSMCMGEV